MQPNMHNRNMTPAPFLLWGGLEFLQSLVSPDGTALQVQPYGRASLQAQDRVLCRETIGQRRLFHLSTLFCGLPSSEVVGFDGKDQSGVVGSCGKPMVLLLPLSQDSTQRPAIFRFNTVAYFSRTYFRQRCF